MKKIEIMSPAGNWTCLNSAINAGCDAVYFGIDKLNMRATAKNFTIEELKEIAMHCHQNNVKAYLTLNTIIYENEIVILREVIQAAKDAGIDAVICSDLATISLAYKIGIDIFISTQLSISNSTAIMHFYQSFGIKRFVLARECSLVDLVDIKNNIKATSQKAANEIEIEVFAHGAMCVSVSGRCFLSEHVHGKSANRGACLQPCRREYQITENEKEFEFALGHNYILSPKDLCTLPFIEKLIKAGVNSLKIEGRNRNPEYVAIVTKAYRQAVDFFQAEGAGQDFDQLKAKLMLDVKKVYNRDFSDGFFMGAPVGEWTKRYGSSATTTKLFVGIVKKYYNKISVAEIEVQSTAFEVGETIMFQGPQTGLLMHEVKAIQVEHQEIKRAEKGLLVAVKTDAPVKVKDRVFVVKDVIYE